MNWTGFRYLRRDFNRRKTKPLSAFQTRDMSATILMSAGFEDITIVPYDEAVTSGDVDAMTRVLLSVGPLGKIARENPTIKSRRLNPSCAKRSQALATQRVWPSIASIWIVTAEA